MHKTTMTPREIQEYRHRLQIIMARIGGDVSELRDEALRPLGAEIASDRATQIVDEADPGTQVANAERAIDLLKSEETILTEVNAALSRIEQGTFGQCENCGKSIPRTRLDALPYARHCVQCARETGEGSV